MTTSFPRSLSCVANTALHHFRSERLTHFVSNSVTRLFCSSLTHPQNEDPDKEQAEAPQEPLHDESKQSHKAKENDEDGDSINKEKSEVGGPKGPEPTRYGDWERNGRCYDF